MQRVGSEAIVDIRQKSETVDAFTSICLGDTRFDRNHHLVFDPDLQLYNPLPSLGIVVSSSSDTSLWCFPTLHQRPAPAVIPFAPNQRHMNIRML